jgi:hypothetical protein
MDYADDSCQLKRRFGDGNDTTFLSLERMGPGDALGLILASKSLDVNIRKKMKIRFGEEAESEVPYLKAVGADGTSVISVASTRLAPLEDAQKDEIAEADGGPILISPAQELAVEQIAFWNAFRTPLTLATGSLGPPMAAMRACTDELLTHWGVDLEVQQTLSRKLEPVRSPGTWFTSRDYPAKMLKAGYSATVYFRLSVDASGQTTECHIQKLNGDQDFADEVCRQFKKNARFKPALDKDGQAVESYYRSVVRFVR